MATAIDPGDKVDSVEQDTVVQVNTPNGVIRIDVDKKTSPLTNFFTLLSLTQLVALVTYLTLIVHNAVEAYNTHAGIVTSPWLFAIAQLFEFGGIVTDQILGLAGQVAGKRKPRPLLRLVGNNVPRVDLLITTCGEYIEITIDTALAACALDYPKDKLRIFVADDSGDEILKARVNELNARHPNLFYCNRPKPATKHHGFKAGNINTVIRILEKLPEGSAPWICILDADMIPDTLMLRALMAHAVNDATVGLVTLPQDFYNIPLNDPLHQNLILQHELDQLSRDRIDAAWCPGTGFVFRLEAYKQVGGVPEFTICEDVIFGWFLNGSAWKTVHVNERLQSGMQPDSLAGHIKQRRKWWVGGIRTALYLKFGLNGTNLTQLTLLQRIAIWNQCPKAITSTLLRTAAWTMFIICLIRGDAVVGVSTPAGLEQILFWYLVFTVLTRQSEFQSSRSYGLPNWRRRQECNIWQGLHLTKAVIQELLPNSFGGISLGFDITGSKRMANEIKERDPESRPGMFGRLLALHQCEGILYHLCLFMTVLSLAIFNVWNIVISSHATTNRTPGSFWFQLVSGVLFPGFRFEQIVALLCPIRYAMWPPNMKPRRAYMVLDEQTGGYRPRPDARGVKFTRSCYLMELPYVVATIWAAFAWWIVAKEAAA